MLATAAALKTYMDTAEQLRITGVMHATTPILWLIDQGGSILFALEEVVSRDHGSLMFVLPRNGPPFGNE